MATYGRVDSRVLSKLERFVGTENVSTREEDRYCYSRDTTLFSRQPDVVIRPQNTQQVSEVIKLANDARIPITPWGAGTSASGSPVPIKGGILLDMGAMNRILQIEPDNLVATVEPGVICDALNEALARHGFFFPPDPASSPSATLGGMVACNASGNRAIKYGTTKDHILAMEVVLPTGEVVNTGSKSLKSVAGFDLTRLMVGSEGSLGVITKITLKITPLPEHYASALFIYKTIDALARAAVKVRRARIVPSMLEFMNAKTTEASFKYAGLQGLPAGCFLLVDCDGTRESVEKTLDRCVEICKSEEPVHVEKATDLAYRDKLISARKAALPALARLRPTTCMEDCTVPVTRLAEAALMIEDIPKRHSTEGFDLASFGHLGDGNLHPTFIFDENVQAQREAFFRGLDTLYKEIVLPMGGSITGEHGIGLIRAPYMEAELGGRVTKLMRDLKALLDPNLILNPGKGKGGPYP
jgi:glycolate oxidase